MDREQIETEVLGVFRKYIAYAEWFPRAVTLGTNIAGSFDCQMDRMEFAANLEELFRIEIPDVDVDFLTAYENREKLLLDVPERNLDSYASARNTARYIEQALAIQPRA